MSSSPYIEELRLTSFKSFRDAILPVRDLTLLVGRNGSGKSNVIDALHVLARLAEGEDLREALDGGRRDESEVRGGAAGCAPFGRETFALGCTVVQGADRLQLDVEIRVKPELQVIHETLDLVPARGRTRHFLASEAPPPELADINARYFNGKRGVNPTVALRSDRLLTAQLPARVPGESKAIRDVQAAASAVIEALRAIFILDPIPHLMRQYVPGRDTTLRRSADNLSAVIGALRSDDQRWAELTAFAQSLSEHEVCDISIEESSLGDVMLALRERFDGAVLPVSARSMSDGMLRFLALAAALLEAPELGADVASPADTLLVIEEVENGLHPSQAARTVELIEQESRSRRIRTLATTHSPAMLTALPPTNHAGVIVCRRDPQTGLSQLRPLVELPSYPTAMAAGTLGEAITERRLEEEAGAERRRRALDELLANV